MFVGQIMIYIGIGLCAGGMVGLIVGNIILGKQKNKLIKKIYG